MKEFDRSSIVKRNIFYSFIFKAIGIMLSFLILPLTIHYLSEIEYGIWTTLFSVLNWVNVLDMGIGLGLRNKLTEAIAQNKIIEIQEYLSTGIFTIAGIGLFLLIIFLAIMQIVEMQVFFNTTALPEKTLYNVSVWSGLFVIISFILSIVNQVYYAYQKAAITGAINISNSVLLLIIIYYLTLQPEHDLIHFVYAFGFSMVVPRLFFATMFFVRRKELIPKFCFFKKDKIRSITNLGIKFFVIQICTIFGFSLSNFLITRLLGPEYVRTYDVIFKIVNFSLMIQTLILTPLWSAYTDAYIKRDYTWIKSTFYKTCKLSTLMCVGLFIIPFFLDDLILLWMHIQIEYTQMFLWLVIIYHVIILYVNDFCMLLNGISKIHLQMYMWIMAAIIIVPSSYGFVIYFHFNIEAIIGAMVISILLLFISLPVEIMLLFRNWDIKKGG